MPLPGRQGGDTSTTTVPTVSDDPEVRAATADRDQARALFDQLDRAWNRLAARRANADLRGGLTQELRQAEAKAREERDQAWKPVVAANDRIRAAQFRAQLRLAEAGR